MNKKTSIIRDLFYYITILLISRFYILKEFRYDFNLTSSKAEIIAVFFMLISIFLYILFVNRRKIIFGIFYSLILFIIMFFSFEMRNPFIYWSLLISAGIVIYIFNEIKEKSLIKETFKKGAKINISNFNKIGTLDNVLNNSKFIIDEEFKIPRIHFKIYSPKLKIKETDENDNLILNFLNNDDLNFTIVVKNKKDIFIKHNINKSKNLNRDIIEILNKNYCQ